jgi:hypothetical protein
VSELAGAGADQDHVLWIDSDALAGLGLDQPRELHDRTAGGSEDQALDLLDLSLDVVAVAANDGELGCRCHVSKG